MRPRSWCHRPFGRTTPELAEARRRGLRVLHRSAALGVLMLGRRGIAVAGTHGKTTTTAMIALRRAAVIRSSFVIGGAHRHGHGGHLGGGDVMIVEADERMVPSCNTRARWPW